MEDDDDDDVVSRHSSQTPTEEHDDTFEAGKDFDDDTEDENPDKVT